MSKHSLPLAELDKKNVRTAVGRLAIPLTDRPEPLKPATVSRLRRTVKVHFNHGARMDVIAPNLFPPAPPRTKKSKQTLGGRVLREHLPSVEQATQAVEAIRSHQPASHGYHALTACVLYAGMRPSEAAALDVERLSLPDRGWGTALINAAVQDQSCRWGDEDEQIGATKTGLDRTVPLPPVLVAILKNYVGERRTGQLVETRCGNRPTYSNWTRAWTRARRTQGGNWHLYDLRHLCATTMVDAGVPLGEVAERLGHTVQTLTDTYLGNLAGHRKHSNRMLDEVWG
jgi:integrase